MNDGVIIGEQSNEFYTKDLPQLIVALDKEDNYIHIRDVKENVEYFCPCCRNSIKPRAFKTDVEYQVQPHFYHVCGSCDEESRVHWIYKNWLFKEGSQFYIKDELYTVKSVDIEKSHDTKFGKYRPDITVYTKCGKTIFFEINFNSAKKEDDYFAKWDELNIDVIEVNIKKLMNEDYDCKIPIFELIYSDGECFKKSYAKKDEYSTIANIKREWKRQEKIDYKIMWERLDWFWLKVQYFKHNKCKIIDVVNSFRSLEMRDKEICFNLISKQSCMKSNNQLFRDIINSEIISLTHMNTDYFLEKFKINVSELKNVKIKFSATIKNRIGFEIRGKYKGFSLGDYMYSGIENKQWDLKFSNILKCVELINNKIEKAKKEIDNSINFKNSISKPISKFISKLQKIENCIWGFDAELERNYIVIHVEVKNSRYRCGKKRFSIYQTDFENEKEEADIIDSVKVKLLENMVAIYKELSKIDGIGSEYRHMFIGGTKFDTNK